LIGCEWPKAAREAASVLSGATADGDSTKVELLRDLLALFRGRLAGRDAFRSAELVDALAEDKAGRWAEYSHGKPLTQRQLARLLRPFAIVPNTVRSGAQTFKGYRLEAFADAFARYLSHFDPSHRHAPTTARVVTDKRSDTEDAMFRIDDPSQASNHAGCDVVTDENHDFDGAAAEEAGEGGGLDV
jgi:hypothetical protein